MQAPQAGDSTSLCEKGAKLEAALRGDTMTRITVWDGADCVGGNKILLQDRDLTLWLDFGQNLSRLMDYYEEFIKPQKSRGLYELFVMGLLPPVRGIYHERFLEDYRYDQWQTQLEQVDGVLLSHAHLDHAGDLQYLRGDIPLICSAESALLLRALQDMGKEDSGTILVRRFEQKNGEFQTLAWNRKETPIATFRSVYTVDDEPEGAQDFWTQLPEGRQEKCEVLPLQTLGGTVNGHRVRFFPVDHSIPGAGAWAVETDAGWVVYTGDLRFRGERRHLTEQFLQEAAKLQPVALLIEGTRISRTGSGYTEDDVQARLSELLQQHPDRLVVANFSMTHLERLLRVWQCARENGKQLVVNPKDLYLLHAWRTSGRELPLKDGSLRLYQGVGKPPADAWEKSLHQHYGDLCITAQDIARCPQDYLLCFGYFDLNELPYLKVSDGVWIQSFSEPMTEEQRIDDARLNRWLQRFGFTRYPTYGNADEETVPLHVSGHASGEELAHVVETIRPRKLIPVHTQEPALFSERFSGICEVVIPEIGKEIVL
jgi:ribonuclease J